MDASMPPAESGSRAAWPPQLFSEQPTAIKAAGLFAGPIIFGVICGLMVSVSEIAYVVLTLLGIFGGLAAGYEHDTLRGGAARGAFIGAVFSLTICEVHRLTGNDSVANTPDPIELIVPVFVVISLVLGTSGAALRRRAESADG